ncbi:MAG: hypothetical protein AAGA20_16775 [Planctomycetota bacterium]
MTRTLLLACAVLGACSSVGTGPSAQLAEVQSLTRAGDYRAAAELSTDLVDRLDVDHPLRPAAEQAQRDVSLASGLDAARTLTLNDRDEEALELLDELDDRYPGSTAVHAWQTRTRRKLANRWFEVARESLANERFEAARAAYENAIRYDESATTAPAALRRLGMVEQYRAELAEEYYYDGVRALNDNRLTESGNGFEKAEKYAEDDPRTKLRIRQVDRERAKARALYAQRLADDGRFGAARAEYLEAARLDPSSAEIAKSLETMTVEAEVAAQINDAESAILRKEFDRAEETLRDARERTTLQRDEVTEILESIDNTRIAADYQRALDLEYDYRFPQAITAYSSILEKRDFYKDSRARLDTLQQYVREAARLYEEAEGESDAEKKLGLYRQIEVFWPEYLDVPEKVRKLQQEIKASGDPSDS